MSQPNVLIAHGDDEAAIAVLLQEQAATLGDPSMAELNLARLDGRTARDEDIRTAASAIPFLAEHRLVILSHPLARLASHEAQERFTAFLDGLSPATQLVLVIEDRLEFKKGMRTWNVLKDSHWLMKWAAGKAGRARILPFPLPAAHEMPGWIRKQAQEMGGQFSPGAAAVLAAHVDNDTRLAKMEINKLLTYTDFKRPVEADDVDLLTANTSQANIFDMVEALSAGNARTCLRLLHRLLEEEDEFNVFGMIVRQFRFLLLAREIIDEGGGPEQMMLELKLQKYPAEKFTAQARSFTADRLEQIYHRLLEIDEAIKTSKSTFPLALDTLVAELAK